MEPVELKPDYRLEPYGASRHDAIAGIQSGLWGPDLAANLRYLQWKYLENPYIREPMLSLVFREDQLVGMRGMYGSRWTTGGGNEVTLPVAGDTIVRPEHRSKGLFRRMTDALMEEAAHRGYPLALNLSGSPPTSLRSMRLGWKRVASYEMVRRGGWARLAGLAAGVLPASGVRVAMEPDPEGMSRLVESRGPTGRIRHVTTPEYLRWRFRNPLSTYRFLFVGDDPLRGYLVLQSRKGGSRSAIIDWEAEDEAVAERLLRGAIRTVGTDSLGSWAGPLTSGWPALLRHGGFRLEDQSGGSKRFEPGLLVARVGEGDWTLGGIPVRNAANWDVRMVASDEF